MFSNECEALTVCGWQVAARLKDRKVSLFSPGEKYVIAKF